MKEILINVHPSNTKVCIVEDNQLQEFWIERKNLSRLVGNIYKGKVMNTLPGMHAAFVNIGLERNAFLYAGDTLEFLDLLQDMPAQKLNLRPGDEVLVQVVKDQFGMKGARISMNISLPGRGLVLMPQIDYVGVSKKIVNEEERKRLVDYVNSIKPDGYGFILRTQSLDCSEDELKEEMQELCQKWEKIKADNLRKSICSLIYKEEDLAIRAVRDMLREDVSKVIINDCKLHQEFQNAFPFIHKSKPNMFEYYDGKEDLLQKYNLYGQIERLLEKKVVLKSGAYLIIDRTEALTVIDVNTGKYVGESNLEDTVFETNSLAAIEIARQLRLRNIGGIVIIDFIDMAKQEHMDKVMEILQGELSKDRTKTTLVDMTPLGLVELTRKKTRNMIESVMLQPCPYCEGDGYLFSNEHIVAKLKIVLDKYLEIPENKALLVKVSTSVFNSLFSHRLLSKECSEDWASKRIYMIADNNMHTEKYEIIVLKGSILSLPDNARLLY